MTLLSALVACSRELRTDDAALTAGRLDIAAEIERMARSPRSSALSSPLAQSRIHMMPLRDPDLRAALDACEQSSSQRCRDVWSALAACDDTCGGLVYQCQASHLRHAHELVGQTLASFGQGDGVYMVSFESGAFEVVRRRDDQRIAFWMPFGMVIS